MKEPQSKIKNQKSKISPISVGIALALAASCFFGACGTLTRLGMAGGADTSALMVVQALMAAVISWSLGGEWPRLERHSATPLVTLSIVGGFSGICMLEGYARLGVAPVAIIIALYPAVVGLYLWIFEGRRPASLWFPALATAITGVVLAMSGPGRSDRPLWEYLFPITTMITLAANDLLVQRIVVNTRPTMAIGWINLFTAFLALAVYSRTVFGHLTKGSSLVAGLVLGGVLFLALQLKFHAIARAGASVVSLVSTSQPALALVIAAIVLHDRLSLRQAGGVGLVMVALVIIVRMKPEAQSSPQEAQ